MYLLLIFATIINRGCVVKYNTFMAESVARVSVNSLLFYICTNLQLRKYVRIPG